jgi:hypothetical protein
MVRMSDVIRDTLQDFKARMGIEDDKGLADALGVSAGTISRWTNPSSASRTKSVSTSVWKRVLAKVGLTEDAFEPVAVVEGDAMERLQSKLANSVAREGLAQSLGVSEATVERWYETDVFILVRCDVWERIADRLSIDRSDCRICTLDDAADLEQMAREAESERRGSGKLTPGTTLRGPSKVLFRSPDEYGTMVGQCQDATVLGRARLVNGIKGLGETKEGLIATPDPVQEGDLVVVQQGDELVAGRLYHIVVVVVEGEAPPQ